MTIHVDVTMKMPELTKIAKELGINSFGMKKDALVEAINKVVDAAVNSAEDDIIADEIAERRANDTGVRYSLEEVQAAAKLEPGSYEATIKSVTEENNEVSVQIAVQNTPEGHIAQAQKQFPESKGDQIRYLLSVGLTKAQVSRGLKTHYSYVHTVAVQWEKKNGKAAPVADNKPSISQQIRDLHDKGWERAAICKKVNKDYSFVHNVIKAYKRQKGEPEDAK